MPVHNNNNPIFQYKVAYILAEHLPSRKANSENAVNTVSALAAEGLDIDLIIPRKWRSLGKRKSLQHKELIHFYDVKNGFAVTELLTLPFSPFKLTQFSHTLIVPIYASIAKHEIIYTKNPLPALLALALGKKVVFEAFRIFAQRKNVKNHSLLLSFPRALSRNLLLYSRGFPTEPLWNDFLQQKLAKLTNSLDSLIIAAQSPPSKETLIQAGATAEKVKVIPTGFNPAPLTPSLTKTEARRKLSWGEHDKIACYAGRIDVEKGSTAILELARKTPEITYVLIGYSDHHTDDWIQGEAIQKGLKNIKWIPWVPVNDLSKFLFASDVLIIPPTADPMFKYGRTVLPMKSLIYMGAGRCILAPALPDTAHVLNERNAVLVEPDNINSAVDGIRRAFEDEAWAQSLAEQAKRDSQKFTWQSRAQKIIAFMNEHFYTN